MNHQHKALSTPTRHKKEYQGGEEQLRIQTTAMQSHSGSTKVGCVASATSGPVSQEAHNKVVKALKEEINENVSVCIDLYFYI